MAEAKIRRFGNLFGIKGIRYDATGSTRLLERPNRPMSSAAGALCGDFGRIALIDIAHPIKPHVHPHAHLLFRMGGTDGWFNVSGRTVPMTPQNVVLVNCWEPHAYPKEANGASSLVLGFYIEPKWLEMVDPWFQLTTGDRLFRSPNLALSKRVRALLHDAADAARGDKYVSRAHEHLVASLMCEVTRLGTPQARLSTSRSHRQIRARDIRIRKAIEILTIHACEPHRMGDVAREAGISRAHLFELFKANVGMSPLMFLHALRMEAAYEALLHLHGNLADIAMRLGFPAQSHFTRFFRNHLGATPSEFRHVATQKTYRADDSSFAAGRPSPPWLSVLKQLPRTTPGLVR